MPWCPNLGRGVDVTTCTKARTKTTQQERSPPMERPRRIPEQTRVHGPPEHSSKLVLSRVSEFHQESGDRSQNSEFRGRESGSRYFCYLLFNYYLRDLYRISEMRTPTVAPYDCPSKRILMSLCYLCYLRFNLLLFSLVCFIASMG